MKSLRVVLLGLAMAFILCAPGFVAAQGCALCYTQAAGSGPRMIQALKSGILVLMFPPMGICVLLTVMGYKKRNKFHSPGVQDPISAKDGPNSDLGW